MKSVRGMLDAARSVLLSGSDVPNSGTGLDRPTFHCSIPKNR
ncbi:hypothetical protein ACWCXX_33120 [Streptomyces sp. NPDC001732]